MTIEIKPTASTGEGDKKMTLEKGRLRGRVKTRHILFLVVGGALWLGLSATSAVADAGPHVLGTGGVVADGCAGCHRVHTASGAKLIKSAQPSLCYTCHDGTGATTDVVDGLGYTGVGKQGTPGALRGGGFTYALVNSSSPTGQSSAMSNANGVVPVLATGAATTSTHDVSGALSTVWGSGGINSAAVTTPLTCGSCHDPHGNGNYRILKGLPVGAASGAVAVNIAEPVATAKTYTTTNYWQVADPNTAGYIANVSAWCTTCHTRYMGGTGSGSTSSGDAVYSYRHTSNGTTQGSASCIQCHVAHGSNASVSGTYSAGVKFPDGTGTATDGRLLRIDNRGTCQMCHNR